jgi:hypothetical protein
MLTQSEARPIPSEPQDTTTPTSASTIPMRQRIRDAVSSKKARREIIKLGGFDVELIQPSVDEIHAMAGLSIHRMITRQAVVPGTDERLFTEEDNDWIGQTPMDEEWRVAIDKMARLMGVNVEAATKNLEMTPSVTTS